MSIRVETSSGVVFGNTVNGVHSFKGIPFAQAPLGVLRFAAPMPPSDWIGERSCESFGPISMQHIDPLSVMIPGCEWNFYSPGPRQSEDCLNLNIWTQGSSGSRPVLFWIHGGAFLAGSGTGAWSDGTEFAKQHDVVVVTMNYRLGALGFLAIGDDTRSSGLSCNAGLLDQIRALTWVQENIEAFGGDPDRVCIFGESAGAMSVATLMGVPLAQGLFSRAIVQSGHCNTLQNRSEALAVSEQFLSQLGVPIDNAISDLRIISNESLLSAQGIVAAGAPAPFRMVVDGEIVPRAPIESIASGLMSSVPLLIGTNTDENTLFRRMGWGPGKSSGGLIDRVQSLVAKDTNDDGRQNELVSELLDLYGSESGDTDDIWDVITTDRMWRVPARELMDAHALAGGSVYAYEFALRSPVRNGELRACHAMEIPFVFGNLDRMGVNEFVGDDLGRDSPARVVSDQMNRSWAEFAAGGVPRGPSGSPWDRYSVENEKQMYFGMDIQLRRDPHSERLSWWRNHARAIVPWGIT
jgi:para-nitrobenzyl esterase